MLIVLSIELSTSHGQRKSTDPKLKQKELERQRKKKEEEIKLTSRLLSKTQKEKSKSINQLRLLNKQIRIREELINAVNNEIQGIDGQIDDKEKYVAKLNADLELRKQEYADMIYTAYRLQKLAHPMSLVFSSGNINQALKRMRYIRDLGQSRTTQMRLIEETQGQIKSEVVTLRTIREDKSQLLGKKAEEKTNLEQDKGEENKLVKTLQSKEKQLRKELAQKQKAAKDLDRQIKKIIQDEIKRAKAEAAKTNSTKAGGMGLTPEAAALSANFQGNKGKLPWPVEKGFVLRGFGEHKHPTLPNVKTVNNGIDIVTTDGSKARAVFEGEVRHIFTVPGMQNAIMINHGEFFTVYTHIETVMVKKGDKIKTKQAIGTIHKDEDDKKTILHFELWKGSEKQDPENWIYTN
ncbi:MAG: hypothetical protein EP332_05570 [Bacteroidetes bacterium]|nr:MAG: hypothetical protein EP332_05570 [Bacteroidota bacterium]